MVALCHWWRGYAHRLDLALALLDRPNCRSVRTVYATGARPPMVNQWAHMDFDGVLDGDDIMAIVTRWDRQLGCHNRPT